VVAAAAAAAAAVVVAVVIVVIVVAGKLRYTVRLVGHEVQLRFRCTGPQVHHTEMEEDQNWSCGDQVQVTVVVVVRELVSCWGRNGAAGDHALTSQHTSCHHDASCRTGHLQNSDDTDHTCSLLPAGC